MYLLSTIDWIILLHVLNFHIRNKVSKKVLLYKYYSNIFPLSHIIVASIKLKLAGRTKSLTEIRFHRFVSCDPLSPINETTKLSSRSSPDCRRGHSYLFAPHLLYTHLYRYKVKRFRMQMNGQVSAEGKFRLLKFGPR